MKKLLLVSLFMLAFIEDSIAEKIQLKCQGLVGAVFNEFIYVNFDDKIVEVVQGSGGNKVEFEIRSIDEYTVVSWDRPLEKGAKHTIQSGEVLTYDTYISDWNEWYSKDFIKHLWFVKIDRLEGYVGIGVTKEPYKIGKKNYSIEEAYSMKCEKRGLSKF